MPFDDPTIRPAPRGLVLRGGRPAVLLFHGLSSGPAELQFLATGLHRAGYTVHVPVLHGYSHGLPAEGPPSTRRWLAQALAAFDALYQAHGFVAVGGLCIGAVLALRVAALRRELVGACIGLSTTLHYDGWAVPWHRRLLPLARWLPPARRIAVREKAPFGVKDERLRRFIERQMRESGGSDAGAALLRVRDLLAAQRLMHDARRALHAVHAPTLLVHARDDDAASARSAFEVAERIGARSVRCVLLTDSYHMISIDREKQRVLAEMLAFLDRERRDVQVTDAVPSTAGLDRPCLQTLP